MTTGLGPVSATQGKKNLFIWKRFLYWSAAVCPDYVKCFYSTGEAYRCGFCQAQFSGKVPDIFTPIFTNDGHIFFFSINSKFHQYMITKKGVQEPQLCYIGYVFTIMGMDKYPVNIISGRQFWKILDQKLSQYTKLKYKWLMWIKTG